MCLVLLAIDQHPLYPLIILSNRDEFYQRASLAADFWPDHPELFAGKDLVKGGSWLGVTRHGHVALITNYRNPQEHKAGLLSRGLLVKDYLLDSDNISPKLWLKNLEKQADRYNKCNLIVGAPGKLYCYSNVNHETTKLSAGVYAVSNGLLDTPWPKVTQAKALFDCLKPDFLTCQDPVSLSELLFPILADTRQAPDDLLPETGVGKKLEKRLSSIFIAEPEYDYGTRSSSILIFTKNEIFFSEKTLEQGQFGAAKITQIIRA